MAAGRFFILCIKNVENREFEDSSHTDVVLGSFLYKEEDKNTHEGRLNIYCLMMMIQWQMVVLQS
jgi:hypothetical protein